MVLLCAWVRVSPGAFPRLQQGLKPYEIPPKSTTFSSIPTVPQLIIILNPLFQLMAMKRGNVIKTGQAAPGLALQDHGCKHTSDLGRSNKKVICPLIPSTAETLKKSSDPDEAVEVSWLQFQLHEHSNGRGMKRNSNLPDSSWAIHKEIYSFTMKEVLCFSGGRQQTCPRQMPIWLILCFCWLKTNMALHLLPQS